MVAFSAACWRKFSVKSRLQERRRSPRLAYRRYPVTTIGPKHRRPPHKGVCAPHAPCQQRGATSPPSAGRQRCSVSVSVLMCCNVLESFTALVLFPTPNPPLCSACRTIQYRFFFSRCVPTFSTDFEATGECRAQLSRPRNLGCRRVPPETEPSIYHQSPAYTAKIPPKSSMYLPLKSSMYR